MLKRFTASFLLLGSMFIAGCETPRHIPSVGQKDSLLSKDARVVFGKIAVIGQKGPRSWKGFSCTERLTLECPDAFRVYVLPKDGGKPFSHMLSGDGSFNWVLNPGEYNLVGFEHEVGDGARIKARPTGRIGGKFIVPADRTISYLGTLNIYVAKSRYRVAVKDEFELAKSGITKIKGMPKHEPSKRLMKIERIPNGEKVIHICNPIWKIKCTDENQGVLPVTPQVIRHEFTVADSRTPAFRWSASPDPKVTYDVIVYEAVLVEQKGIRKSYVVGPIVEYVRGIKTNTYKNKKKLKPNATYYWSVRLRKNGTISKWSTISYRYFAFFLIGSASGYGYGLYFNFTTPG